MSHRSRIYDLICLSCGAGRSRNPDLGNTEILISMFLENRSHFWITSFRSPKHLNPDLGVPLAPKSGFPKRRNPDFGDPVIHRNPDFGVLPLRSKFALFPSVFAYSTSLFLDQFPSWNTEIRISFSLHRFSFFFIIWKQRSPDSNYKTLENRHNFH